VIVKKINSWEYEEGGEELKVPYRASTVAVCDGNMPYITANRLIIKAIYLI
jgi:hypothetical protein